MTLAVLGSKNFLVASLLSGPEIMVVCIVILVLFGAKKIPEFAKGLGKGISEFKKASSEVTNEIQQAIDQPAPTQKTNTPATPASQDVNQPPTVTKI